MVVKYTYLLRWTGYLCLTIYQCCFFFLKASEPFGNIKFRHSQWGRELPVWNRSAWRIWSFHNFSQYFVAPVPTCLKICGGKKKSKQTYIKPKKLMRLYERLDIFCHAAHFSLTPKMVRKKYVCFRKQSVCLHMCLELLCTQTQFFHASIVFF